MGSLRQLVAWVLNAGPVVLSLTDPQSHVTRLVGTARGNGGREELSGSRVLSVASEIPALASPTALPSLLLLPGNVWQRWLGWFWKTNNPTEE